MKAATECKKCHAPLDGFPAYELVAVDYNNRRILSTTLCYDCMECVYEFVKNPNISLYVESLS